MIKLNTGQIVDAVQAHLADKFTLGEVEELYSALFEATLRLNGGGGEAVKRGFVLVPLKLTREMEDYLGEEDWDWPELLAIAGAVSEEEYDRAVEMSAAPKPQQAAPWAVLEGWPCVVVESDFEQNTVTVKMKTKDWRIHAGEYFLSAAPKPQGDIQEQHDKIMGKP